MSRLKGGGKRIVSSLVALFLIAASGGALWYGRSYLEKHDPFLSQDKVASAPSSADAGPNGSVATAPSKTVEAPAATPAPHELPVELNQVPRSVSDAGSIHLLYVTAPGTDASMGLSSRLYVTREAPNAVSARLTTEVGKDMTTSFNEAFSYVQKQPRGWEKDYSLRLSFEDKFTPKDGGSAGTGFTIAMLAAIEDVSLAPDVAVTGDLTIDGEVQPVGAVVEKIGGAIDAKCTVTLVPQRNSRDVEDFVLLKGTSPLWETQIFSIASVDEALSLARKDRPAKIQEAIARFSKLRARLPAVVTPNYLRSPIVQSELKEVLALAPNHLSASALSRAAEDKLPKELSLSKSVDEIVSTCYLFVQDVVNPPKDPPPSSSKEQHKGITVYPEREFGEAMRKLNTLSPILDRRSIELKVACVAYAGATRAILSDKVDYSGYRNPDQWRALINRERGYQKDLAENYDDARSKLMLALRKLGTDGVLMSEILKK